jgi:hypothetical protein
MNTQLIDRFEQLAENVNLSIANYRKVPVRLTDIKKNSNTFYTNGNMQVRNSALKDLLNIFSIKSDLVNEIKDDKDQWVPLQRTLANIKNDRTVTAIVNTCNKEQDVVRFINTEIDEERPLDLQRGLDMVKSYLESNDRNITLHQMHFNPQTLQIETQIRDNQSRIDVFNDGEDIWNSGFNIGFGENLTSISPFLLRLICTNGLTSTQIVANRYIKTNKLKQSSFFRLINKTVDNDLSAVVRDNCDRLKKCNASLRELFTARDILLGYSKDLAKDYFDDTQVQEAYKPYKIKYKNSRWLASANSNINGYKLFNDLTHCASHQSVPDTTRMQLNHLASTMFFKGPDMVFQAPDPFYMNN